MVVINSVAFKEKHGIDPDTTLSLSEVSKLSGFPKEALQEVYNRGIGAYKTNPLSVRMKGTYKKGVQAPMSMKLGKEQWAMARVYSFVMKRSSTFKGSDNDIREKYDL